MRLGVEAPRTLPVLRGELDAVDLVNDEAAREARHHLRGRLNSTTMALYLAQRQLQNGLTTDAEGTIQVALANLEKLEGELTATQKPPPAPLVLPVPKVSRRVKTLVVEDNQHESALLEGYLRLCGMDVASAEDGQQALTWLATNAPPDAVLLDMRMPRCDGPTTVAAIRANPSFASLKVFAVTGARAEEEGVPSGFDGWFSKPLNPANIVATLTTAIR